MMSKTHITVGIAASLAVCRPATLEGIFASIIGGTAGGILCDIECRSTPQMRDALYGRFIALGICLSLMLSDMITNAGIWAGIKAQSTAIIVIGLVLLTTVCLAGRFSAHRTFTHSLLYCLLITLGFSLISHKFLMPVAVGCLSHLLIDTLNKKPVPWFYPIKKEGFCLKLCYAGKTANAVLMWTGLAASVGLLIWRITCIG